MQLASTSESRHGECRWPTRWCPPQAVGRNEKMKHQRKTRSCRAKAANGHSQGGQGEGEGDKFSSSELCEFLEFPFLFFAFNETERRCEWPHLIVVEGVNLCLPVQTMKFDTVLVIFHHISSYFCISQYISVYFVIFLKFFDWLCTNLFGFPVFFPHHHRFRTAEAGATRRDRG